MDSDLDAIRAKRMAELQSSSSSGGGSQQNMSSNLGGGGAGGGGEGNDREAGEKYAQEEETRRTIMSQILSPEARERLARIALVKPEKAKGIEQLLMRMAQGGQLRGRVSEDQLIGVLNQVEQAENGGRGGKQGDSKQSGKIVFSRKKVIDSDDSDFDM